MKFPDFILGTVHKAKGLEFENVMITDDFIKVPASHHSLHTYREFSLSALHAPSFGFFSQLFLHLFYVLLAAQVKSQQMSGTCCTWQ